MVEFTKEDREEVFKSVMGITGYEGLYEKFNTKEIRQGKAFKDMLAKYGQKALDYKNECKAGSKPRILVINDSKENVELFLMVFLAKTALRDGIKYSVKDLKRENYQMNVPDNDIVNTMFDKYPNLAILDIQDSIILVSEDSEKFICGLLKEQLIYRYEDNLPTLLICSAPELLNRLDSERFEVLTSLKSNNSGWKKVE